MSRALIDSLVSPQIKVPEIQPPNTGRRFRFLRVLIWGSVIGAIALLAIWFLPGMMEAPPVDSIQASGRIEGREVALAPKDIQGRVTRLLADEGDKVQKGQLVAELSSQQLAARRAVVAANIANVDAQIQQAMIDISFTEKSSAASIAAAEAAVSVAAAGVSRSEAVLAHSKSEYERYAGLFEEGVVSKSALDQATMNYQTSQADSDVARKDFAQAQANLAMAQASQDTIELKRQDRKSVV